MLQKHFVALTYKNFRLFWIGQFVSLIGTWMQSTVQPYLAYKITGQPFYLGLIGFAATLPSLLFTLPAGVLIERFNKKKVVIFMQSIMMTHAFCLAYLALSGQIKIWHIIILAFVGGCANSIELIARQSMLIEMVDKEALPNAIALNSTIFNAARVLGPSIAAPFLVFLRDSGEGWAFFANGVSFIVVILMLFIIKTKPKFERSETKRGITEFFEGQKYIFSSKLISGLIIMVLIPSLFGFPVLQQIPAFAKDVLATSADTTASPAARNSLLITFQGIGALISALSLAYFSHIKQKTILLTIGQFVFAIGIIGLSFSRLFYLSLFWIMLIGWGTVTQLALTNTLIQLSVSDNLRGRVISTYLWAMNGITPIGSLIIGSLSQTVGVPQAALIGGTLCIAGYLALHLIRPIFRLSPSTNG